MPLEWSPDARGTYHALAHYSDTEVDDWTALCGAVIPPSLSQRIESEAPPQPSHRQCAELARQIGGLGPRDVQRMVESGAFPPPDDPRWKVVTKERRGALEAVEPAVQGPTIVSRDSEISGVVRGELIVSSGAVLVVNGIVGGTVRVESRSTLELHGIAHDVLVEPGGRAEIYGTVTRTVTLEKGATALVEGVIGRSLSDPWNGATVADDARIG